VLVLLLPCEAFALETRFVEHDEIERVHAFVAAAGVPIDDPLGS
jgi:hypothetical protein